MSSDHVIFTHLYSPCLESIPSLQHKSRPNHISSAPLLPMSGQSTLSTSDIELVHHLICRYMQSVHRLFFLLVVSKLSTLPMSSKTITSSITSQNATSSTHVQSEYHLCCSCLSSCQYIISTALILSDFHLF